jgi:hypothetical protein
VNNNPQPSTTKQNQKKKNAVDSSSIHFYFWDLSESMANSIWQDTKAL